MVATKVDGVRIQIAGRQNESRQARSTSVVTTFANLYRMDQALDGRRIRSHRLRCNNTARPWQLLAFQTLQILDGPTAPGFSLPRESSSPRLPTRALPNQPVSSNDPCSFLSFFCGVQKKRRAFTYGPIRLCFDVLQSYAFFFTFVMRVLCASLFQRTHFFQAQPFWVLTKRYTFPTHLYELVVSLISLI